LRKNFWAGFWQLADPKISLASFASLVLGACLAAAHRDATGVRAFPDQVDRRRRPRLDKFATECFGRMHRQCGVTPRQSRQPPRFSVAERRGKSWARFVGGRPAQTL